MQLFGNQSIRNKIIYLAAIGILGFVFFFAYSWQVTTNTVETLKDIDTRQYPILEAINDNKLAIKEISELFSIAANEGDDEALEEADQLAKKINTNLESIKIHDASRAAEIDELLAAFNDYYRVASELARGILESGGFQEEHFPLVSEQQRLLSKYVLLQNSLHAGLNDAFSNRLSEARKTNELSTLIGLVVGVALIALLVLFSYFIGRGITQALLYAVAVADKISSGNWDEEIEVKSDDEAGRMLLAIRTMRDNLRAKREEEQRQQLIKTRLAEINEQVRGDLTVDMVSRRVLDYMVPTLNAQIGALYLFDEESEKLKLASTYAFVRRKSLNTEFALGESLVGQAALERKQILLENIPEDYIAIESGTGQHVPRHVLVTPIVHEDKLKGVIEIGSFNDFSADDMEFVSLSIESLAVALNSAESRVRLREMLETTRKQAEEMERQKEELSRVNEDLEAQAMELVESEQRLKAQQEELRVINEELEQQTQALRASEESLQAQQEELRVTNEELEEQAKALALQKQEIEKKNAALEEQKKQLELSSKYKSEFLSTMSHELRTPLNSILILSNALAENKKGNLEPKQVEHCQVIHSAGSDLLALINDILDLSKVEEGKMQLVIEPIEMQEMADTFRRNFEHVAQQKGVYFNVEMDPATPEKIYSDRQRIDQILKNLLSNAFKFTEQGGVTLSIGVPDADTQFTNENLKEGEILRLSVTDTGIGIPLEKQKLIFEAFQQADGTTSRKYGGTGLGLTISRELSKLLGGEVQIFSEGEGKGTTFTLYIPFGSSDSVAVEEEPPMTVSRQPVVIRNDEAQDSPSSAENSEKTVLIIEDDEAFASVLLELAEEYGFDGFVCSDGETGLEYAYQYRPGAIILDIGLPGINGWEVMEKLKENPRTRDIPVHFLSGEEARNKAIEMGAIDFLTKPVSEDQIVSAFSKIESAIEKNVRKLLVIEDNDTQSESIRRMFDNKGIDVVLAKSGSEALELLRGEFFDCMILDLSLPDMSGFELLKAVHDDEAIEKVPVIVYTARDLTRDEESQLRQYADRIILKTDRSSERLLSEASLFLHWLDSNSGLKTQKKLQPVEPREDIFVNKKVLLVDDDMRNIYALSATLEDLGFADVVIANNGFEALDALEEHDDIDIVLMDIMMPEMDGYEAMGKIRSQSQYADLPILALTAKAMKDDRAKCIEAGANDYIAKPIDVEKLQSLMRVWLHK